MQMELKACCDEYWLIICHICAAYNCSEEEYPPRPLPIPPDYIDNLQSGLVKVKKGILTPTEMMFTLFRGGTKSDMDARKENQDFYADGAQDVLR